MNGRIDGLREALLIAIDCGDEDTEKALARRIEETMDELLCKATLDTFEQLLAIGRRKNRKGWWDEVTLSEAKLRDMATDAFSKREYAKASLYSAMLDAREVRCATQDKAP